MSAGLRKHLEAKVACDKAAHQMQWELLDGVADERHLAAAAEVLQPHHWADVEAERALDGLCGWPGCGGTVALRGQGPKFRASLSERKVYNVERLNNFCSRECARRSTEFSQERLQGASLFLRKGVVDSADDAAAAAAPVSVAGRGARKEEVAGVIVERPRPLSPKEPMATARHDAIEGHAPRGDTERRPAVNAASRRTG